MANTQFDTIQEFLAQMDPKNEAVQKAFGTSERQTELMWAALSAVREESGLAIPGFRELAAKVINFPSPYISKLRKHKVIERGERRGEWSITAKALKKMEGLLSGEPIVEEAPGRRRGSGRRTPKVPAKLARQTVGQLIKKLQDKEADLDGQIAALVASRDGIRKKIQTILEAFRG